MTVDTITDYDHRHDHNGGESRTRLSLRLHHAARLADSIWLLVLVLYVLLGTGLAPFHGDESTLIYMSRDYHYQFIARDLSGVRYSDPPISPTEQDLRLLNGTVHKYLVGLAWHLSGFTINDINEQWDWGADWFYNVQNGHLPTDDLLITARRVSVLFLAAGVTVIFALAKVVGGRPTAYLVSLYYALNPALLLNGRRAMMEGSLIFFSLLVVLAGLWFWQHRSWWTIVALGVASGLAVASKHTGVISVVAVFGASGLYSLIQSIKSDQRRETIQRLFGLTLAGIIGLGLFYAMNPAWWGDPLGRIGDVLDRREILLSGQVATFGGYESFADRLAGFGRQVFGAIPQYYEVSDWADTIGEQITRYESSIWRGVSIGGSTGGAILLATITVFGLWRLLRARALSLSLRLPTAGWVILTLVVTSLLTPLEWQRYYLLVYPVIGILGALGLTQMARYVRTDRLSVYSGRWQKPDPRTTGGKPTAPSS